MLPKPLQSAVRQSCACHHCLGRAASTVDTWPCRLCMARRGGRMAIGSGVLQPNATQGSAPSPGARERRASARGGTASLGRGHYGDRLPDVGAVRLAERYATATHQTRQSLGARRSSSQGPSPRRANKRATPRGVRHTSTLRTPPTAVPRGDGAHIRHRRAAHATSRGPRAALSAAAPDGC
jgi:hypothetical protein